MLVQRPRSLLALWGEARGSTTDVAWNEMYWLVTVNVSPMIFLIHHEPKKEKMGLFQRLIILWTIIFFKKTYLIM